MSTIIEQKRASFTKALKASTLQFAVTIARGEIAQRTGGAAHLSHTINLGAEQLAGIIAGAVFAQLEPITGELFDIGQKAAAAEATRMVVERQRAELAQAIVAIDLAWSQTDKEAAVQKALKLIQSQNASMFAGGAVAL